MLSLYLARSVDGQAADQPAEVVADRQAGRDRPDQPVQRPAAEPAGLQAGVLHEQQGEHHEGEGRAVVEAGLAREGIAHPVEIPGVHHLDQAGQHRVGRRQHGADQQRAAPVQTEQVAAGQAGTGDAHQHDRAGQQVGVEPGAVQRRQAQLEAGDEQRHQHGDLGQVLHPGRDLLEGLMPQAQALRPDRQAEAQADHRGGHRKPAQIGRAQGQDEQKRAEYGGPVDEAHGGGSGTASDKDSRCDSGDGSAPGCPANRSVGIGQCDGLVRWSKDGPSPCR